MKRDAVTAVFPDATKEQIDKLMAASGEDINKANARIKELEDQLKQAQKPEADPELAKQLRDLKKEIGAMREANSLREMREKVAKDTGIPVDLLTGDTEEACTQAAEGLKQWRDSAVKEAQTQSYPSLRDPGEVTGAQPTGTNAAWGDLLAGLHQE